MRLPMLLRLYKVVLKLQITYRKALSWMFSRICSIFFLAIVWKLVDREWILHDVSATRKKGTILAALQASYAPPPKKSFVLFLSEMRLCFLCNQRKSRRNFQIGTPKIFSGRKILVKISRINFTTLEGSYVLWSGKRLKRNVVLMWSPRLLGRTRVTRGKSISGKLHLKSTLGRRLKRSVNELPDNSTPII